MDTLEKQLMLSKASTWGLHAAIEPLGYSPREFENPKKGTFLDEIKRTGKVIYDSNTERETLK